jgi:hypothetical protein
MHTLMPSLIVASLLLVPPVVGDHDAYPFFVVTKRYQSRNFRAADCEYPSLCTMSMVQDGVFDVILIEEH